LSRFRDAVTRLAAGWHKPGPRRAMVFWGAATAFVLLTLFSPTLGVPLLELAAAVEGVFLLIAAGWGLFHPRRQAPVRVHRPQVVVLAHPRFCSLHGLPGS
jgi:hypothetical protein